MEVELRLLVIYQQERFTVVPYMKKNFLIKNLTVLTFHSEPMKTTMRQL